MMSGCPGGSPEDKTPNWIITKAAAHYHPNFELAMERSTHSILERNRSTRQGNGIEKIALENHGCQMVYNPETLIRLRDAVVPLHLLALNLDPSHLMWMGGDPIAAVLQLGAEGIIMFTPKMYVLSETMLVQTVFWIRKPLTSLQKRTWECDVALGHGHDVRWWKEFLSVLSMEGYDDAVSQEMEDLTMPALTGIKKST